MDFGKQSSKMMVEDLEQIKQAQAGDERAMNYLIGKWQPILVGFLRSKNIPLSDAEDIAQDVMLIMFQKITQLNKPEAFGAWLRRIAIHKLATHLREKKNLVSLEPEMGDSATSPGTRQGRGGSRVLSADFTDETLLDIFRKEDQAKVQAALEELPDMYSDVEYGEEARNIIRDFFYDNLKIAEIAKKYDRPEGTIKRILFAAKKRLADLLANEV